VRRHKQLLIPGFEKKLYVFQRRGVWFLERRNGRALIADEMGLGKTIQALAYVRLHPKRVPVVIVCPAIVKLNWAREIKECTGREDIVILSGRKPYDFNRDSSFIIINYDILSYWTRFIKPKIIIIDECHKFKSRTAKRTRAIKRLAKGIPYIIALTGTPILNRPVEFFNIIKLIDPHLIGSFWDYGHEYCDATYNGFAWVYNGATNTDKLHKLVKSIMIRRKKSEVMKDLPDKRYSFTPFEIINREDYGEAESNFISYVKATKGEKASIRASNAESITQIEELKQIAVRGKLEAVIEWIEDFLSTDTKLVVFAVHKFVIDALMERFGRVAVKVDGSVSIRDRERAVKRFQRGSRKRLFVGNIMAAGIGITLTRASNVAIIEFPWTPGDLEQAIDRLHRIGQKNSVTVWYLLAVNTIEYQIAKLLDEKRKVLDAVLDGKETEDNSLLMEIINNYKVIKF